jgi:hypothetical protein
VWDGTQDCFVWWGSCSYLCVSCHAFIRRPSNSMVHFPSWEANSRSSSQEILHLLWIRSFFTMFTRVRQWSLSWARCIQSISTYQPTHPIFLRSILMSSSHLRLRLPRGLFPSCFPIKKFVCISQLSHVSYMPHPSYLPGLDHPNVIIFGEAYKLWSSSLCSLFHPPATSSGVPTIRIEPAL